MRGSNLFDWSIRDAEVHTMHRALDPCKSEWRDLMQALENVTTAGIHVNDCSPQPGSRTRGNNELR